VRCGARGMSGAATGALTAEGDMAAIAGGSQEARKPGSQEARRPGNQGNGKPGEQENRFEDLSGDGGTMGCGGCG
jgi:hypothetical protein